MCQVLAEKFGSWFLWREMRHGKTCHLCAWCAYIWVTGDKSMRTIMEKVLEIFVEPFEVELCEVDRV